MERIEEQILSYPHLSVEKKREIEDYVEAHPEWASLLRDVRAFEGVGSFEQEGISESLLRAYVVAEHMGETPRSSTFDRLFAQVEAALADDPALRECAETIRARLTEAEAALDPVAHFESVTGHALEPATQEAEQQQPAAATAENGHAETARRDATPSIQALIDRFLALPLAARGVGVAVVLLLTTYLGLFVASTASQSPIDRLATFEVSGQMIESYYSTNTRSATPTADTLTADKIYLNTLSTLRGARTSTLGLFPKYNPDSLQRAKRGLQKVIQRTDTNSFLALEAHFYLGKVRLAQREIERARNCFELVVREDGRKADEARRILRVLNEEYGGPGTDSSAS